MAPADRNTLARQFGAHTKCIARAVEQLSSLLETEAAGASGDALAKRFTSADTRNDPGRRGRGGIRCRDHASNIGEHNHTLGSDLVSQRPGYHAGRPDGALL